MMISFFSLALATSLFALPGHANTELSPFWAQEAIGADLVRQEMITLLEHPSPPQKISTAVFDLGFERDHIQLDQDIPVPEQMNGRRKVRAHHGTMVMNILNGPAPYGTTDQAEFLLLGHLPSPSFYHYHFRNFEREGVYPKVISNSVGWQTERVQELADQAAQRGIFWFLAAGNRWPEPVVPFEIESRALVVGSFSPSGLTSYRTQLHEKMLILAPADKELASINGHGVHHLFGESSGATPLVAGTAINLLSLIPSLTHQQLWQILRKTSWPSIENKLGASEHPGLINAYRAFHVILRLRNEICSTPAPTASCLEKALRQSENFVFSLPRLVFPSSETWAGFDSTQKNLWIQRGRRTALLTGHPQDLLALRRAYSSIHLTRNAELYQFLSQSSPDLPGMEAKARGALDQGELFSPYYKYMSHYSPEIATAIEESASLSEFHRRRLLDLISVGL